MAKAPKSQNTPSENCTFMAPQSSGLATTSDPFARHRNSATLESMWKAALDIIRQCPQQESALDFETQVQFMFIILGVELESRYLAAAYFSGLNDENLDWFLSRLQYEQSKAS